MAQAVFLLYPSDLFGAIFGSISLANGTISLIADPLFRLALKDNFQKVPTFKEPQFDRKERFIQNTLDGDYTIVHYVFGVLCVLSAAESIVLVHVKNGTNK